MTSRTVSDDNGRWRFSAAWVAVFLVVAVSVTACTSQARRQTLTFFFDGVPEEATADQATTEAVVQNEGGAAEVALAAADPSEGDLAPAVYRPKKQTFSVHKPVRDNQCDHCHAGLRWDKRGKLVWRPGSPVFRFPEEELCLSCHTLEKEFRHGPADSGNCRRCHFPHKSPRPHLLRNDVRSLCLSCHDKEGLTERSRHDVEDLERACNECHNPHQSSKRYLIRDDVAPGE